MHTLTAAAPAAPASVGGLVFSVQPRRLTPRQEIVFSPSERQRLLERFGDRGSSYLNLQEGLAYFDMADVGFLSYRRTPSLLGHINIVPARPICRSEHLTLLLSSFMNVNGRRIAVVGLEEGAARRVQRLGLSANQIGVEFNIPIQDFTLSGSKLRQLRKVRNAGQRDLVVRELRAHEVDMERVREISTVWRQGKRIKNRELRAMTRPAVFDDEPGVLKLYAFMGEKLVGYVFFDPCYRDGKLIGYGACNLRCDPAVHHRGVLDYIVLTAIERFQREGLALLSLGLAPLHGITESSGDRPGLRRALQLIYRRGNAVYNFRDLAFHKRRYRALQEPIYACLGNVSDIGAIYAGLRTCNVF